MAHSCTFRFRAIAPFYLATSLCASAERAAATETGHVLAWRSAAGSHSDGAGFDTGTRLDVLSVSDTTAIVRAGTPWSAPVLLNLGGSRPGDLGAIELELRYDPAVLHFETVTSSLRHAITAYHLVEPGLIRFAAAATEAQAGEVIVVVEAHFTVRHEAPAGARAAVSVVLRRQPLSTTLVPYDTSVASGASALVVR